MNNSRYMDVTKIMIQTCVEHLLAKKKKNTSHAKLNLKALNGVRFVIIIIIIFY